MVLIGALLAIMIMVVAGVAAFLAASHGLPDEL
jgi:hypothetical protein